MNNDKIYFLEILRFFSSLMVVIWHYQHFFLPFNTNAQEKFLNIESSLLIIMGLDIEIGTLGVYIFFGISGVVFSATYLNTGKILLKDYFVKRFARLYPLHFFTLILVAFIQFLNFYQFNSYEIYFYNDLKHFFLNLFFISHWGFEDGWSFNAPIWTVSLEIQVYILFFLLINFLNKSKYMLSFIIIIFFYVLREFFFDTNKLNAFILFFSGTILYRIYQSEKNQILLILFVLFGSANLIGNFKIILFSLSIISGFLYLDLILNINLKIKRFFEFLGNLTYASYLIHTPIQLFIIYTINNFNLRIIRFENISIFFCFIFIVYFFSYYVFKYFEKPASTWIKKFYPRH